MNKAPYYFYLRDDQNTGIIYNVCINNQIKLDKDIIIKKNMVIEAKLNLFMDGHDALITQSKLLVVIDTHPTFVTTTGIYTLVILGVCNSPQKIDNEEKQLNTKYE